MKYYLARQFDVTGGKRRVIHAYQFRQNADSAELSRLTLCNKIHMGTVFQSFLIVAEPTCKCCLARIKEVGMESLYPLIDWTDDDV